LLWLYFFKHYALKDKARYLERFGIPFMLAKIRRDDFDDDENRLRILNSMSKMGSDGVGIVTENSDVQVLNGISGGNPEAFRNWFSYIDDIFALTILGQTASSKNASGMSRGQIQENVRRDLLEADAHNLENTVNRQIMVPLEKFRYGTEGQFRFHIEYQKKENLKDKAEIVRTVAESVKIFRECGYSIDHEKIAGIFEIPELVMRKDKGRE
jgi:phage gp29-like protein